MRVGLLVVLLVSGGLMAAARGDKTTLGLARVEAWAERYGPWLAVSRRDIERAKGWLDRHGHTAVFLCRLVPGIRSLISIPAGFVRMPLLPFLGYTALGTGVWAALLAYAGRLLGERYTHVETYLGPAAYGVLGLLVLWWVRPSGQAEMRRWYLGRGIMNGDARTVVMTLGAVGWSSTRY